MIVIPKEGKKKHIDYIVGPAGKWVLKIGEYVWYL